MNPSVEFVASTITLVGILFAGIYNAFRRIHDTESKVDDIESKASKDKTEMQIVLDNLYKTIVKVQNDNAELLRAQLAMQERDTKREQDLGETKADNIKLQMQVNESNRLKDVALANEKV